MSAEKIILGIDPGTTTTGYGVIQIVDKKPQLLTIGIIDLTGFADHYVKLKYIFDRTVGVIDEYHPDELAIEAPFYGKNVQSMLKLGRAQGAAISAALQREIPIFEYAPRKVKMAITGIGSAAKEQVSSMLKHILHFEEKNLPLDATDGLAVALCHFYESTNAIKQNGYSSWSSFIKHNQDRVVQ